MTPPKVALLGIPYDASSSYQRGPAGAPVAIREALWSEAGNAWTEPGTDLKDGRLDDEGDLWFNEREPGPEARARIEDAVASIVDSGRRPLLLGGDHSITYPALRGVRHHHKKLAILHLDAHPDLYHEFQGDRYDCGSKLGYLQANVMYALKHSEVAKDFCAFLSQLQERRKG